MRNDIRNGIKSSGIILGWMVVAVVAITLPLWIGPAVIWMLCTGRSLKSCGYEANKLSEGRDGSPQPSAAVSEKHALPQEATP